jgi:hypothetical protein
VVGGALSFTGVQQSTPFGAFRSASDKTRTACVTLSSAGTELVASFLAANGDAKSVVVGPGQTTAWNTGTGTAGGDIRGAGTTIPGTSATTTCGTLERDKPWAMIAVPLKPALMTP